MSEKHDVTINAHTKFHDDILFQLGRSFADLPELEWTAGPLGNGIIDGETRAGNLIANIGREGGPKHIQHAPHSDVYCVRFIFRKSRVYLAYAKHDRLDELMRFADALTHELWPYRERGAHLPMREHAFNFSLRETEIDLAEWRMKRPDVIELIQQIITRLAELDLIRLPADRAIQLHKDGVHSYSRTRSLTGKIESILAYQTAGLEELLFEKILAIQNLNAGLIDEIKKLNAKVDILMAARLQVVMPSINPAPLLDEPIPTDGIGWPLPSPITCTTT